jgi:hypothetical protein
MTHKVFLSIAALAVCLSVTACSTSGSSSSVAAPASSSASAGQAPVSGVVGESLETMKAKVEAVDMKTREVTLSGPDGKQVTIVADERVKNLAQLKRGDMVVADYYESIAYEVKSPGEAEPGVEAAGALGTAEPGRRPAALERREMKLTATIVAIDKKAPSVTLKSAEGETRTIRVRHPEKLERVNVGDLVEITFTQALMVSVEAPE